MSQRTITFISSVLAPDEESESFWINWVRENPSRQKAVHDARLLALEFKRCYVRQDR